MRPLLLILSLSLSLIFITNTRAQDTPRSATFILDPHSLTLILDPNTRHDWLRDLAIQSPVTTFYLADTPSFRPLTLDPYRLFTRLEVTTCFHINTPSAIEVPTQTILPCFQDALRTATHTLDDAQNFWWDSLNNQPQTLNLLRGDEIIAQCLNITNCAIFFTPSAPTPAPVSESCAAIASHRAVNFRPQPSLSAFPFSQMLTTAPYDIINHQWSDGLWYQLQSSTGLPTWVNALDVALVGDCGILPSPPRTFVHSFPVTQARYSPDAAYLVALGQDQDGARSWMWHIAQGTIVQHASFVVPPSDAFALHPRLSTMAWGGYTHENVYLFAIAQRNPSWFIWSAEMQLTSAIAFSPDAEWLASGGDLSLRLWRVQAANDASTTMLYDGIGVTSVAFSADSRTLAAGYANGTIQLWDVLMQQPLGLLAGHADAVTALAFSAAGDLLISGGADATARLWRLSDSTALGRFDQITAVTRVGFAPDDQTVLVADGVGGLGLWDVASLSRRESLSLGSEVQDWRFEGDNLYILSLWGDVVLLDWEIPTVLSRGDIFAPMVDVPMIATPFPTPSAP